MLKFNNQKGFALPLILFVLLVVTITIVGLAPRLTTQTISNRSNLERLTGNYITESGVKVGIKRVIDFMSTNEANDFGPVGLPTVKNESIKFKDGVDYLLSYNYNNSTQRVTLTASTNLNGQTYQTKAEMRFKVEEIEGIKPPNVIDLIRRANENPEDNIYWYDTSWKRHNHNKWSLKKDRDGKYFGRPYNGDQYNYILFDDEIRPEFRIDYTFEYTKTSGAGGVGVLYGATEDDTADNFTSYAAKFNHNMGAFSVTKFTGGDQYQQEFYSTNPNDMDQSNREGWGYMIQPNGTGTDKTDPLGNKVGTCSITFENLKEKMNNYYNNLRDELIQKGKPPLLPDGREIPDVFKSPRDSGNSEKYMITIEVKWEEVDVRPGIIHWEKNPDGTTKLYKVKSHSEYMPKIDSWERVGTPYKEKRARHIVSIDGNPVLDFFDFSDVYTVDNFVKRSGFRLQEYPPPKILQRGPECKINLGTTHKRTGLRVANVDTRQIRFYNTPNLGYGQYVSDQFALVWLK